MFAVVRINLRTNEEYVVRTYKSRAACEAKVEQNNEQHRASGQLQFIDRALWIDRKEA